MESPLANVLTDLGQLWPWWVSSMLKATVWLWVGALADRALRRRSSSVRHVVALLVALCMPLIFVINLSPRPEVHGWQPLAPVWEGPIKGQAESAIPKNQIPAVDLLGQYYTL